MKSFGEVALVALIVVALTEKGSCFGDTDDHPMMKNVQKICREKVPVDDEIYRRATVEGDIQSDDRNLQCYVKCVFQTSRAMTDDGKVDLNEFVNGMKQDAKDFYGPIMLSCQNEIEHDDLCVKGMRLYECFKGKAGKNYYFV